MSLDRGWIEKFAQDQYFVQRDFLNASELTALNADFDQLRSRGGFRLARVGASGEASRQETVRRDEISWFEPASLSPAQEMVVKKLDAIKSEMNRELFLALESSELHYAFYPPGGFYVKHVDRFRDDDTRVVSMVLYLNQAWDESHGGRLLLETPNGDVVVDPRGGTLVLFLSADIPHEVQPALADRRSIAAWFKRRAI